jgi:LysR family nitrogen assimilation transcriptional regulator
MDLRQLTTFLEVAETGSLRRAALRLRVVETALSRQMRLLEAEFGVALFRRHGRGLALTEAGQRLRERAAPLVVGLAQLKAEIGIGAPLRGRVSIGLPWLLLEMLSEALARGFIPAHPEVNLRFVGGFADQTRELLLASQLDLALMFDPAPARGLLMQPLLAEDMVLIAAPEAGYALDRPVPFRRLGAVPLVLPSPANPFRQRVEALAAARGLVLDVRFEVEATAPQKALAAQGVAQMLGSRQAVREELASGRLSAAPVRPMLRRTLCLARPRNRPAGLATERLADAICTVAAGWVAEGAFEPVAGGPQGAGAARR